ncbi:hypothetical protein BS329_39485 [Amycolatopsis coloradensis]|uniref:FAD-binding domain-containing protein n=1 Tax=Amycolatopsis coloradensis TaxID=76021 RepID=A0A1R0KE97_9PSEU|nr:tryptophan 7-halogenase [Amycolatopsis coloradensis]OLZ43407.1 hypothetical protein BS329_39485 [Amycolatopsis coloradensis]
MNATEDWDLVIVGAGPAGSSAATAALRAAPTARVLMLDTADFPRDKVCGDGVAPHAMDVLAGLGIAVTELSADTEPVTVTRDHLGYPVPTAQDRPPTWEPP